MFDIMEYCMFSGPTCFAFWFVIVLLHILCTGHKDALCALQEGGLAVGLHLRLR